MLQEKGGKLQVEERIERIQELIQRLGYRYGIDLSTEEEEDSQFDVAASCRMVPRAKVQSLHDKEEIYGSSSFNDQPMTDEQEEMIFDVPGFGDIELMVWKLAHSAQLCVLPLRIPELLGKIKNRTVSRCLFYSILAAGSRFLEVGTFRNTKPCFRGASFAAKALSLLKITYAEVDLDYVWSCILVGVFSLDKGDFATYDAMITLAINSAKSLRLYDLENSIDSIKKKYGVEGYKVEVERMRRVWWMCYMYDRHRSAIISVPASTTKNGFKVNLPSSDWWWRYGGDCAGCSNKVHRLNTFVKTMESVEISSQSILADIILLDCSTNDVFKGYNTLDSCYKHDSQSVQVSIELFSASIRKILDRIESKFLTMEVVAKKVEEDYRVVGELIAIEKNCYKFVTEMMYNSSLIVMCGSYICSDKDGRINPENVLMAKSKCLDACFRQVNVVNDHLANIPAHFWHPDSGFWLLPATCILANCVDIPDFPNLDSVTTNMHTIVGILGLLSKFSIISEVYYKFVVKALEVKYFFMTANTAYNELNFNMELIGVTKQDIHPWITFNLIFNTKTCPCFVSKFNLLLTPTYLGAPNNSSSYKRYIQCDCSSSPSKAMVSIINVLNPDSTLFFNTAFKFVQPGSILRGKDSEGLALNITEDQLKSVHSRVSGLVFNALVHITDRGFYTSNLLTDFIEGGVY